jgi:hypothetical protein
MGDSHDNPNNPNKTPKRSTAEKAILRIDPGTLVLIVTLLILLPLLATGFISQ